MFVSMFSLKPLSPLLSAEPPLPFIFFTLKVSQTKFALVCALETHKNPVDKVLVLMGEITH